MPITTILTSDGAGFDTYGYYDNAADRGSETTTIQYNQGTYQPILKFDLPSLAGKAIMSATLRVYMEANGDSDVEVGLAQINDPYYDAFVESSIYNWNALSGHTPTLNPNIGVVGVGYTEGWKEWSFPGLSAAVQEWVDGSLTNNGFVLTTTGIWDSFNNRQFRTKEYGDGSYAAQLVVEWTTYNETARIQTIAVTTSGTDIQSLAETGKDLTILTTILTSDGAGFDTYGYYDNAADRGSETTTIQYNQGTYQPILKFDLPSLAGKAIMSATLRVYMEANGDSDVEVGLAQINDPYYDAFVESSIYNWNALSGHTPTLNPNIGVVGVGYTEGWKEWSFPGLSAAVQEWVDGSLTNNGFVLTTTGIWDSFNNRQFRTKEYGDGSYAAQLVVEWTTYNETARIQTIAVTTSGTDIQSLAETGKDLTILSTHGEADVQSHIETGKLQSILSVQGEADIYSSNETGKELTILSVQGEADTQSHIETGKLQSIAAIVTETDILTIVETGALLLMKAWIVSRFPWAFSEVDLKTATFSERRNIN